LINNNIECLPINFKTKRYHKKRRKREKHQSFDVRNKINQALLKVERVVPANAPLRGF
jgi:hypothetical protein